MDIQRIASFSTGSEGGNPAGVVISDALPPEVEMQQIAAEVGYSETAFAARQGDGFHTRYFAPEAEVPFCGHATIALGAALGEAFGAGVYPLYLNDTEISVEAFQSAEGWSATLQSPNTSYRAIEPELAAGIMQLFGWATDDLDANLPMTRANGGAEHVIVPLRSRELLRDMAYDFDAGAKLMQDAQLVTINLVWRENSNVFHSRNPFAGHGVYEDPATGAAAAALAGYLRDAGHLDAPFVIHQGVDMGAPSRLEVAAMPGKGAPIRITGAVRTITT